MNVTTRRRGAQWIAREALPEDYQKVAWVACDASSYFDTGFTASGSMKIVVDAAFGVSTGDSALFSVGSSSGSQWTMGTLNWSQSFVAKYLASNGQVYLSTRDTERHVFGIDAKHGTANVDSEIELADFRGNIPGSGYKLLIGRDQSGNAARPTIYGVRIYLNDEIAARLVPCYHKDSGEIGLYDTVSDSFLTNAGSGVLTKGSNIG